MNQHPDTITINKINLECAACEWIDWPSSLIKDNKIVLSRKFEVKEEKLYVSISVEKGTLLPLDGE